MIARALFSLVLATASMAYAQTPAATVTCPVIQPQAASDGDRALAAGKSAEAEALFSAQVSANPTEEALIGLVRSQLRLQKVADALASAQRGAAAKESSPSLQALLGDALVRAGQIPQGIAAYSRAISLDRCNARAHFGAARVYQLTSMHAKARRELSIAYRLQPTEPEVRLAYIQALPASQRLTALRTYLAAYTESDPETHDHLVSELALLEKGVSCTSTKPFQDARLDVTALYTDGVSVRDWGLLARVNQHAPELLEIDSTVSGIVLTRSLAEKLGARSLSGAQASAFAYVEAIRIGELEYHNCPVRLVDDATLDHGNSLIGLDFFRDHLIHLDFVARAVTLKPLPDPPTANPNAGTPPPVTDAYIAPDKKTWWQAYIDEGRILMPTLINKKGSYLFLLDTASTVVVLSPPVARASVGINHDVFTNLEGTSGDFLKLYFRQRPTSAAGDIKDEDGHPLKLYQVTDLPIYRFAGVEHGDRFSFALSLAGISRAAGVEVAGVMGFSVLKDYFIDIDYRDGLVNLRFDQNHQYRTREDPAHSYFE